MVAIDIEFEEEDKSASGPQKKEDTTSEDISLEFSATTELINLAEMKKEESAKEEKEPTPSSNAEISGIVLGQDGSGPKTDPRQEISEEMKAVVNKVKAESAKVRSLDDARQKKPAPVASVASPSKPQVQAPVKPPSPASAKVAAPSHSQSAVALQADPFSETRNSPLLERFDPLTKVEIESEIKVAKAETRGEVMSFYLSEAKLLEYQVVALLKRLPAKSPEEIKILQQIQKRLNDHTKKKPSF